MAFTKEIFDLAKLAAQNKGYIANAENFSAEDVSESLRGELKKFVGNYYDFQKNKIDLYELIATTIDIILPRRVEAVMGQFAEIQNLPQGARATFRRKLNRLRARQFVGRVSPAGIYETFRLDSDTFEVYTHAIGGGIRIDWERYLDGTEDWSELISLVNEAMEYQVYKEINTELQNSLSASGRPTANKVEGSYSKTSMRNLVNTVRAYGSGAVIFATESFVASMGDDLTYGPTVGGLATVSAADVEAQRSTGFIGQFYGTPIVVLPNSYTDETNTAWQLDNKYAYVMPTGGEKVVKVVLEGTTVINDLGQLPGDYSMEMMMYKKFGTAILYTNTWGIYKLP